ncbi:hypothetical protein B0T26DRAFT_678818 [Lasiosphaeria miniovina]|uniref:Uncharacterized protein n=1 Tax=Lasiosphaeria miniovina TaxID=1954250 RepID=A0AA40A517_9PEZI|nr:uncharacterized protein B0T26DRAFT_678818 [Lasiosphaeria miniovina]KAK0709392.1 hypothetical protein B0T26DRAFT_678818 [Lasiosphaeria miniovina]
MSCDSCYGAAQTQKSPAATATHLCISSWVSTTLRLRMQPAYWWVDSGADVDAAAKPVSIAHAPLCNYEAGTALHRAVGGGKFTAVRALVNLGANADDVGHRSDERSPVYLAAQYHYSDIVDFLLQSLGVDEPATRSNAGVSLPAVALRGEVLPSFNVGMMSSKCSSIRGADISIKYVDQNGHEFPYLYQCAAAGHNEVYIASELVSRGISLMHMQSIQRDSWLRPQETGSTALHAVAAARNCRRDEWKTGEMLDQKDNDSCSALWVAVSMANNPMCQRQSDE